MVVHIKLMYAPKFAVRFITNGTKYKTCAK